MDTASKKRSGLLILPDGGYLDNTKRKQLMAILTTLGTQLPKGADIEVLVYSQKLYVEPSDYLLINSNA